MDLYIKIFEYFVLGVDVILVCLMSWCVFVNARNLIFYDDNAYDRPFRAILLMQCLFFLHSNIEALQRHIISFIIKVNFQITADTIQSLLSDRGGMLCTGMCAFLLTKKWIPEWFKKLFS